jgi:hypothetical protein
MKWGVKAVGGEARKPGFSYFLPLASYFGFRSILLPVFHLLLPIAYLLLRPNKPCATTPTGANPDSTYHVLITFVDEKMLYSDINSQGLFLKENEM